MSELNFKKFSDLDVLENISATSYIVIEEDGDVKRLPIDAITQSVIDALPTAEGGSF